MHQADSAIVEPLRHEWPHRTGEWLHEQRQPIADRLRHDRYVERVNDSALERRSDDVSAPKDPEPLGGLLRELGDGICCWRCLGRDVCVRGGRQIGSRSQDETVAPGPAPPQRSRRPILRPSGTWRCDEGGSAPLERGEVPWQSSGYTGSTSSTRPRQRSAVTGTTSAGCWAGRGRTSPTWWRWGSRCHPDSRSPPRHATPTPRPASSPICCGNRSWLPCRRWRARRASATATRTTRCWSGSVPERSSRCPA